MSMGHAVVDHSDSRTDVFSEIRKCNDPWDVLFARAEGLHAHGHSREACILGMCSNVYYKDIIVK